MVYRRKLRTVRKRRAVRKRAPARRRLQSKLNYGDFRDLARGAALAMGAKAVYSKFRGRRKIPVVNKQLGPPRAVDLSEEQGGGYSQWTQRYATGRFGRLTARKIDKLSNDSVIFRHQLIGPFNDYGKRFMFNATNVAGDLYYPLVLFELNSATNFIQGTQTFANPVHQMYQTSANAIAWSPLNNQNADGTVTTNSWVIEKSVHTNGSSLSAPMEQSIHKWSSLDLELWGQTQKPTVYTIYLCQLNEDVTPDINFASQTANYSNITNPNAIEFWQSMIKRFTYSPLAKVDDGFKNKKIKILKQYKINIDPTANYENDPDPHVKTMKLFYRFNRKCNFEWKYANAAGFSQANMNDADWQQENSQNQCHVHPNARMYVMVRASNYVRGTYDTATNTTNPSISWVLRSCHLINN